MAHSNPFFVSESYDCAIVFLRKIYFNLRLFCLSCENYSALPFYYTRGICDSVYILSFYFFMMGLNNLCDMCTLMRIVRIYHSFVQKRHLFAWFCRCADLFCLFIAVPYFYQLCHKIRLHEADTWCEDSQQVKTDGAYFLSTYLSYYLHTTTYMNQKMAAKNGERKEEESKGIYYDFDIEEYCTKLIETITISCTIGEYLALQITLHDRWIVSERLQANWF